jgi:hypothetical protein
MDGGGFDGRRARHLFGRSLGPIGQGYSKSRAFEPFVRVSLTSALTFTGQRLFCLGLGDFQIA